MYKLLTASSMISMIGFILIINVPGFHLEPNAKAQLDLPPLPPPSSAQPEIMLNSYVEGRDNNEDDEDRSIRHGPPYYDRDDKEIDLYRSGRQNENFRLNLNPNRDENLHLNNDRGNAENGREYYDRGANDKYRVNNNDRETYPNGQTNYDREQNYRPNYNQDQNYRPPYNEYNQRNPYQNDADYERFRFEEERREKLKNEQLKNLLEEIDRKSSHECSLNVVAQWLFETNINDVTQLEAIAAQHRYSDFQRALFYEMKKINQSDINDEFLFRQVRLMSVIGPNALPPDQLDRYNRLISDMLAVYNGAAICAHEQPFHCGLKLQPHLKEIMAKSRDWDELQYTWLEWRRKTGRNIRDLYEQVVELTNDAAHTNNFTSGEEYWQYPFDAGNFRQDMDDVWSQILPLYEQLHTYVRRKLREFYGPDKIRRDAPIPDHVLGNMYGQSWANILDITIPYPGRKFLEVTPAMITQSYTPLVVFQIAEEFYISMNMTAMPRDFWLNSVLEEPIDRVALCQPSAWDFCNGQDYRVKMCTHITHKDLITAHHELSHIHYFLNYRNLPKVFRDGANPGFHEAIGDAIGLSVATPHHLQKLGLVQKSVDDTAHDINFLFALAMDKVVFLPFALALETWRWDIFSGRISREEYNCHWWLLREQYGGIKPPVLRSELDFDAGSKYHVAANIPYISVHKTFKENCIDNKIIEFCANERIAWKFIPPRSPNFGGLWESNVKSVKTHIKKVASNALLSYEEMNTLIIQIEGIINSRPITNISNDPNDPEPLTPAHFLTGGSIVSPSEPTLLEIPQTRLSNWERVTQLTQQFWKRYSIEYLHTLQQKQKWKINLPNIQINDLVLILDKNLPSTKWLLGIVIKIYPGQDNKIRVVDVKTKIGVFKRAISKLSRLPLSSNE